MVGHRVPARQRHTGGPAVLGHLIRQHDRLRPRTRLGVARRPASTRARGDEGAGQVVMGARIDCSPRTVADGFRLPEGLRWHAGRLWMSDMDGGAVYTVGANGAEPVCDVPAQPSGLGWD